LVVDTFGDLDTREATEDIRVIDGAMQTGFRTKPLIAALSDLLAQTNPIGLVLGSGFEDKPRLVAALASRFRLLGTDAQTIRTCKDPKRFFGTLDEFAIRHPETQTEPPDDVSGWLSKRVGGSGGRHIRDCNGSNRAKPRRYFQRRMSGTRYSIGALAAHDRSASTFAVSKQWTSPSPAHPYRFGGCVSLPKIPDGVSKQMMSAASRISEALHLVGLASFDFIVDGDVPYLLEVNPRPGASIDVLDDASGSLFKGHVAAWMKTPAPPRRSDTLSAKAIGVLHADRGELILPDVTWPIWSADRGPAGTFVPFGAPIASAFAEGATADGAEALVRTRLAELEDLIYGHANPDLTGVRHG
jgi:predicted ATP-grasp superfamily ATP-dependent carboligase